MKLKLFVSLAAAVFVLGAAGPADAAIHTLTLKNNDAVGAGTWIATVEQHAAYNFRIVSITENPSDPIGSASAQPFQVTFSLWKDNGGAIGTWDTLAQSFSTAENRGGTDGSGTNWGAGTVNGVTKIARWDTLDSTKFLKGAGASGGGGPNTWSMHADGRLRLDDTSALSKTYFRVSVANGGQWSSYAKLTPEPATVLLASAGLAPLVGLLKRRRRSEVDETEETEEVA